MQGLMQDYPLTLPHFFDRAERLFPKKEIVTATGAGQRAASTYGEWADAHPPARRRARRARHLRRRPGRRRSPGTRPATSSCTSRRRAPAGCCTRSTSGSSPSSSPTSSTTPRTRSIFVDRSLAGAAVAAAQDVRDGRHVVVMDDGKGDVPDDRRRHRAPRLRGRCWPARRAGRVRTSTTRTRPRRCATRAAPPATRRASSTRTARRSCTRWARCSPTASASARAT